MAAVNAVERKESGGPGRAGVVLPAFGWRAAGRERAARASGTTVARRGA